MVTEFIKPRGLKSTLQEGRGGGGGGGGGAAEEGGGGGVEPHMSPHVFGVGEGVSADLTLVDASLGVRGNMVFEVGLPGGGEGTSRVGAGEGAAGVLEEVRLEAAHILAGEAAHITQEAAGGAVGVAVGLESMTPFEPTPTVSTHERLGGGVLGGVHGEGGAGPEAQVTVHAEEGERLVMEGKVQALALHVPHLQKTQRTLQ